MQNSQSSDDAEFYTQYSDLWHLYTQTYSGVTAYLDKALRSQADIKLDDFHILTILAHDGFVTDSPTVVRMGEIANDLRISPSRLTYQVERLIGLGWVDRTSVKEDRRGKGVFITETGYQRYLEALAVHSKLLETVILADTSLKETDTMEAVMSRILKAVS